MTVDVSELYFCYSAPELIINVRELLRSRHNVNLKSNSRAIRNMVIVEGDSMRRLIYRW